MLRSVAVTHRGRVVLAVAWAVLGCGVPRSFADDTFGNAPTVEPPLRAPATNPPVSDAPNGITSVLAPSAAPTTAATRPATPQLAGPDTALVPFTSERLATAELGFAVGSSYLPGGLRAAGRFMYQLSAVDWFEGTASFTLGADTAGCFRDRQNQRVCQHGVAQGKSMVISAGVRRWFASRAGYLPFARAQLGLGVARYSSDEVAGLVVPLAIGGGLRKIVANRVAVVASGDVMLGVGVYNAGIGTVALAGLSVLAGVEFEL